MIMNLDGNEFTLRGKYIKCAANHFVKTSLTAPTNLMLSKGLTRVLVAPMLLATFKYEEPLKVLSPPEIASILTFSFLRRR